MSKIVILNGSMRKNGNTDLLVQEFAKGAGTSNDVEIVSVADYFVNPCIGCNSCFDRAGNEWLDFFHLEDIGRVYVRGAKNIGDVKNTGGLKEAFELGKKIVD